MKQIRKLLKLVIMQNETAKKSFISAVESKDKSIDINKCLIFVKK